MAESQQLTLILEENGQSQAFRLSAESVTIGRTADNAIRVSDALSSRQHCQVERRGASFWVQDLKSRNGTKLNGKSLTEPTELKPGDRIQVGDSIVHFQQKKAAGSRSARQRRPLKDGVRFRLRVLAGNAETKAAVVSSLPFVVGSKSSCGLVLDEDDVSPEHVMLVADRGQVHLVDLSGTATTLDGKPVRGRVLLTENSQLGLGSSARLRVEAPGKGSARSSARRSGRVADSARRKGESAREESPRKQSGRPGGSARRAAKSAPVEEIDDLEEVPVDEVEELSSLDDLDDDGSSIVEVVAREGDVLDDVDLGARLEAAGEAVAKGEGPGGGMLGLVLLPLTVLLAAGGLFFAAQANLTESLADPQPSDNRIRNWSFEEVAGDGRLPGWDLLAGESQAKRNANEAGYGRASLALSASSPDEPEVRSEKVRVSPGRVYRVRAATARSSGAAGVLRVDWSRESDPDWSRQTVALVTDFRERNWKDVSGSVIAPFGATHAQLVGAATGDGEVRFDRLYLGEATEPDEAGEQVPVEAPWEVLSGPQELELWADPSAVITVTRHGEELLYGLGLATPSRVRDPLGHQRSARIDQPLSWQADDALLAIGALPFPAPIGTQFDFVGTNVTEGVRLRWTLGRDAQPLPLVFSLPAAQRIEDLALDGQSLPKPTADGVTLNDVAEMTWGKEAKQVSFRFTAPAAVTVYPQGAQGVFVVLGIPPRKMKNGDLRLGIDLTAASLSRGAKVQQRFREAKEARARGALTRALEIYASMKREFAFDPEVVARAKEEAAAIRALAEQLLGAVEWAQRESRRLAHPAFAQAAQKALQALERDFSGTSELDRARTLSSEVDERVRSDAETALNTDLARLNRTAQEHMRQGRDALARLIYKHVVDHDAKLAEVRKAKAALERLQGGPK